VPVVRLAPVGSIVITVALFAACQRTSERVASRVTDDFGDTIIAAQPARRIVSLNPATTEILFAIGAGGRIVGRTAYDVWPVDARKIADVGPGLRPNVEAVLAVHPDLVLLYASDDNRDAARRLRAAGVTTASYRVDRIADFARVTRALGALTGDTISARVTVDSVRATLEKVRSATASLAMPTVFWPLYDQPLLAVGSGSFLNELITIAGGKNVYAFMSAPSPRITVEDLVQRDPEVILLSPASRERYLADARWQTLRAVRERRLLSVDTNIVMRPGPRLGEAAHSLAELLHPGAVR
jgi:ABC-type Fe3+-hydroxamate transport system substrate-binding protein